MLLKFTVSNWKSFREPTSLSLVAGKEKQHADHIQYLPNYKLGVLPISVIFGANAAGKSNLIKAIDFAVNQIVSANFDSLQENTVDSFRLEREFTEKDSEFEFVFVVNEILYRYAFSLTPKGAVSSEVLERFKKKRSLTIYSRNDDGIVSFEDDSLTEAAKNVLNNPIPQKLVLSYVVQRNVPGLEELLEIYRWFRFKVIILTPHSRLIRINETILPQKKLSKVLSKLDTSVSKIGFIPVQDPGRFLPSLEIENARRMLKSGSGSVLVVGDENSFFKFEIIDGEMVCQKMISYHKNQFGEDVAFELSENSDGTRRCLHLFPAFNNLVQFGADCCYFIDELDRSLHTNILKQLLASYLATRNQDTRSQLILTNHDVEQLDQNVLRRDEIWIAERNATIGNTSLVSLDEYKYKEEKIRKDRVLAKLYLDGRIGGIPRLDYFANLFDYADEE